MATKKIDEHSFLSDDIPKAINELSQTILEITVPDENNKEPEPKSVGSQKELNVDEYIKSKLGSVDGDDEDISEIRQITFRMAKMWDSKGHVHEAMDLYKKIIKKYNGSAEAKEAKKVLTDFAKRFESEGRYHLAQALYDELFL